MDISERIKTAKDTSSVSEVDTVLTIGMPAAPAKDWSIVGENGWLSCVRRAVTCVFRSLYLCLSLFNTLNLYLLFSSPIP